MSTRLDKNLDEEIQKETKRLKVEKSIAFDIFDVKIILFIFLIILYFDIKDDLWRVRNVIMLKFKKNKTMIPSTILLFVIIIGYFVWLYLYNKRKKLYNIKKDNNNVSKEEQETFDKETMKINSYRNALIVGLGALSIALLLIIGRLLPVFLFNFIIAFYYGISAY